MKKTVIILSTLFFILQILQAQQPRFTEFRTSEEIENGEWQDKITVEAELGNYILQLVTSREKSDYDNQWLCVQVLDKSTRQLVQEMELGYGGRGDSFEIDDYNFDGYDDFSLLGGYGTLDNSYSFYFLFDPETKTFFDSGFDGTNLEFHADTKTITSSNRCCAGSKEMYQTFKLVDNRMILLEEQCLDASGDEVDKEGNLIFEEVDCDTPHIDIQLQSVGLKKNFRLRMAIYDEDMAGGFVLYKGQKERIPIHFDRSENVDYPDGNSAKLFYYNEMHNDENNGVYSFTLRDASVVDNVYYVRKKDRKRFTLKIISQLQTQEAVSTQTVEARSKEISVLDGTVILEISEGTDFPCIGIHFSDKNLNRGFGTYMEIKKRGEFYLMYQWKGKEYANMNEGIEDVLKEHFISFYEGEKQEKRGEEVWSAFVNEGGLQSFIDFVNEIIDDEFLNSPFNETYG